jgi:hypothetical protein
MGKNGAASKVILYPRIDGGIAQVEGRDGVLRFGLETPYSRSPPTNFVLIASSCQFQIFI